MKSKKAQLAISAVCVVLGLMLAYQFQNANNISNLYAKQQVDELQQQLKNAQQQKLELEKSIEELDKKIEEFEDAAATTNGLTNSLKSDLDKVRMFAGQTKVQGPGVVITLSPMTSEFGDEQPVVIYADYLLQLINELNASGAEAISINDERIVNSSTVRDIVTGVLKINGVSQPTNKPFEIKAIGEPATLEGGLKTGLVQYFAMYYSVNIKIEQQSSVTINKYNKVIDMKYAKPIVKEGD